MLLKAVALQVFSSTTRLPSVLESTSTSAALQSRLCVCGKEDFEVKNPAEAVIVSFLFYKAYEQEYEESHADFYGFIERFVFGWKMNKESNKIRN